MGFEDSGNDFGERAFIVKLDKSKDLKYKWMAQSGGSSNTRMKAKASVPAGVAPYAGSHEFSGTIDLSGMLAINAPGADGSITYKFSAADLGHVKHSVEA